MLVMAFPLIPLIKSGLDKAVCSCNFSPNNFSQPTEQNMHTEPFEESRLVPFCSTYLKPPQPYSNDSTL